MTPYKLSDEELLECELIVSDAYDFEGLVREKLPNGTIVLEPIARYVHERYEQGERVFCCACGRENHKWGYRVRCSDDSIRPLGNCCALPRLGSEWTKGQSNWKGMRQRQRYLITLKDACPDLLRAVARLETWDALGLALRERQRVFFRAMPDVYKLLVQAAKRDGLLEATERVKNIHWDPEDPGDEPKWKYLPVKHTLDGLSFLRHTEPHKVRANVERAIRAFADVAGSNTGKYSDQQLKQTCAGLRRGKEQLELLHDMATAYLKFFESDNLNGIVRWSMLLTSGHDGRLRAKIGRGSRSLINIQNGAVFEYEPLAKPDLEIIALMAA